MVRYVERCRIRPLDKGGTGGGRYHTRGIATLKQTVNPLFPLYQGRAVKF
jgi:hypothetical protein